MSNDPMTQLREAAVQVHELFTEYISAGFTENQALYLVGQLVRPQPPTSS